MLMPRSPNTLTPGEAARNARIICIALLAGQVLFLALVAYLVTAGDLAPAPAGLGQTLFYASAGVFVVLVPLAFVLRARLLGGDPPPPPSRRVQAHILFFGLCEVVSLLSLVAALVARNLVPAALIAFLAMAVQAVNFPREEGAGGGDA
jgi:hypothetical protein